MLITICPKTHEEVFTQDQQESEENAEQIVMSTAAEVQLCVPANGTRHASPLSSRKPSDQVIKNKLQTFLTISQFKQNK